MKIPKIFELPPTSHLFFLTNNLKTQSSLCLLKIGGEHPMFLDQITEFLFSQIPAEEPTKKTRGKKKIK